MYSSWSCRCWGSFETNAKVNTSVRGDTPPRKNVALACYNLDECGENAMQTNVRITCRLSYAFISHEELQEVAGST